MAIHAVSDDVDQAASFLRAERLRRGLAAEELAARVGVHPASVLRWERGVRLAGPAHIDALARALEVDRTEVTAYFDALRPRSTPHTSVRGHGLRVLRARRQVPASRIAASIGVRPATVYNWEAGRARLPLEHLPALADELRLEAEVLRMLLSRPTATEQRPPASPLRRLRHRCGLSQEMVSARIGVSRQLIGCWERGEQPPPLGALRRLATVYGQPVSAVARAAGVQPPTLLDPRRWSPGDLPGVLQVLREWNSLTQGDVAEHCGCSVAAVRGWERGRGLPRRERRRQLEALFGLAPGALVRALPRTC